jgi:hypothetical protein
MVKNGIGFGFHAKRPYSMAMGDTTYSRLAKKAIRILKKVRQNIKIITAVREENSMTSRAGVNGEAEM